MIATFAYRAALRISEVLGLFKDDIIVDEDGKGFLFVRKSKTDQNGQGTKIPFVLANTEAKMLSKYFVETFDYEPFLFQLKSTLNPITYSTATKELKKLFEKANLGGRGFSTHCFRGGAASAALGQGWDAASVMATGRWRSTTAFQAYIQPQPLPLVQIRSQDDRNPAKCSSSPSIG